MRSVNLGALRRHKYAALLTLLLFSLASQSFAGGAGAAETLSDVVRTVLGIAIFVVVFERPRERAVMGAVLVAMVALGWARHFAAASLDHTLSLALHALMSLFLWAAVAVILRDLFGKSAAGAEKVLGAICGYLIAGDAWAGINAVAFMLLPSAYGINPDVSALLTEWHGRMALFSYYSISQMLTLGYGDVTPVRAPATTISLLTTLFGVFYTAIIVSQFVGLAQSVKEEAP